MKIIKFEWVKWRKSVKNKVIVLFLCVLAPVFAVFVNQQRVSEWSIYIEEQEDAFNQINDRIISLKQNGISQGESEASISQKSKLYKQAMNSLDEEFIGMKQENWQKAIRGRITYQKLVSELVKLQEQPPFNVNIETLEQSLTKDEYFLKQGIQPVKYQKKIAVFNSLQIFFEEISGIFFFMVVILLFFDLFCLEYEGNHLKLLYTQPFRRPLFANKKITTAFLISLSIFFISTLLYFIVAWFLSKDLGSLSYPIILENEKSLVLGHYFLCMLSSFFLWLIVILFFLTLLSKGLKNSLLVFIIAIFSLSLPILMLNLLDIDQKILRFVPYQYVSLPKLLEIEQTTNGFLWAFLTGVCILSVLLLLLRVCIRVLDKKIDQVAT